MKTICCAVVASLSFAAFGGRSILDKPVSVAGTGEDQTREWTKPVELEPDTLYSFYVKTRGAEQGGVAVMGPNGAKMYLNPKVKKTGESTFVFRSPKDPKAAKAPFELGQWHVKGKIVYERAEVGKVRAAYRTFGDIELGYGERIDGDLYSFEIPASDETGRNVMRIPSSFDRAEANWTLGNKASLTLTYELPGREFRTARVSVLPQLLTRGELFVEASADGGPWTPVGSLTNKCHLTASLPAKLLPARQVRVRLRGGDVCWTRVSKFGFDGEITGPRVFAFGATEIFDAESGRKLLDLKPWDYLSEITGERLPSAKGVALWRESSGRKVARGRPLPAAGADGLVVRTAANEAESKQLVVTPEADVTDVRVTATALEQFRLFGRNDVIPASAVRVREVGYLMIDITMDPMGARGRWPDPLFEQAAGGCAVKAGENQPFWVTVKPPKGTPAGTYKGRLNVAWRRNGATETAVVPLEVEVFGFELPDEMTCETAFGCSPRHAYQYHRLKTREDKQTVTDKYLDLLGEHHISPYNPAPLEWPHPKWNRPDRKDHSTWTPVFDWAPWDAAMERALARWHFNTFSFPLGSILGSGNFQSRTEPSVAGVSITNNPAAYDVLVGKYLKEVERHLVEKGWIDKAYIYWFDEPSKEDFAFVRRGNEIMKRHAPRLRRMLTEEANKELVGGPNLWCPLTGNYYSDALEECRKQGDQFWWYITFSSKPPLVNEHVEHAGVDNRLWLWQTWKENVTGILIWEVCHWTAPKTYTDPDRPQNPYEDAMCWTRDWQPWNSGEGRYIYPPKSCFAQKEGPVLDAPVDSIRFEMLREGLEDYEYFAMLRKKDPKSPLLEVPQAVMKSVYDYSTDPLHMEAHRERLARALAR